MCRIQYCWYMKLNCGKSVHHWNTHRHLGNIKIKTCRQRSLKATQEEKIYIHMYACVRVCMYVCMYVCVYAHAYIYRREQVCIFDIYFQMATFFKMGVYIYIYIYIYIRHICYSSAGRSVLGKTLPEVLSTVLGNRPIWLSHMPQWAECP